MAKKKTKKQEPTVAPRRGSRRLQIRCPDDWREAIEAAAERAGVDVSTFAREAMREKLPKRVRNKLSEVSAGGNRNHAKPTGG